jgi:hypothetical protein
MLISVLWAGQRSRNSDWLKAGRSRDRIPVEARFSAPVQTDPGAHPASCTMGTGSFPGVKSGQGVTLTPHPLLMPRSWKSRAIPLLPLWACTEPQCLYTLFNKSHAAWYFIRPAQAVTWCTVAIIIWVVLVSPYLCSRGVSLSSIHYDQAAYILTKDNNTFA